MSKGGRMQRWADLAEAVGCLLGMYLMRPTPTPRWTTAEVLAMHRETLHHEIDKARLEAVALRAEMAAQRAERARRHIGWLAALGAAAGVLVVQWLT